MAKIVELEKQLMQRNKELDVIRVSGMGKPWLDPGCREWRSRIWGRGILLASQFGTWDRFPVELFVCALQGWT